MRIVDTRASPTADFTAFETFAFTGPSDMNPDLAQDIPSGVALNLEIANAEMREELTELGPSPVSRAGTTPGDLGFGFVFAAVRCSRIRIRSAPPCDWIEPVYTEYTAGTPIIGLVDPAADELVFGSVIQGVGDDPEDFADWIDDDVDEVFDDYPNDQTGK